MIGEHPGLSPQRITAVAAVVVVVGGLAFMTRSALITPAQLALALTVVAVGMLPALWHARAATPSHYPLFALAGLFYAICFGMPFALLDLIWPDGFPEIGYAPAVAFPVRAGIASSAALALIAAGVAAFAAAFVALRPAFENRLGRFGFTTPVTPGPLRVLAYAMLCGFLAHEFIPAVRALPSAGQLLGRLGFVAFAVMFVAREQGLIGRREAWAVFGVVLPAVLAHKLFTSLMTPAVMFALLFFILSWPAYRKQAIAISLATAALAAAAYFPAQEIRVQTQQPQYQQTLKDASILTKVAFFARVGMAVWGKEPSVSFAGVDYPLSGAGGLTGLGRRIFLTPLFNHVLAETPDKVPYWGGASYANLFTGLVPRALWKGKPKERFGHDFGVRYRLIAPADPTSVNIPWMIELLANFGAAGMIAGMAVIGALFALVDRVFNSRAAAPLARAVGVGMVFNWVYPESNFTVMCGDLLPLAVLLYVYFRFGLKWLTPMFEARPAAPG